MNNTIKPDGTVISEDRPSLSAQAVGDCTHCDGAGGFRRAVCCGNGTPLGDCCGNPNEEMEPCPQCGGSGELALSVADEVSRIEDAIASGDMGAHMAFTKMRQLISTLTTPPQPADGGDYRDKALAWDAVCVALNQSYPGWATDGNKTGLESAVATIHKLAGADGEDRVELAELIEAAKAVSDMYTHAWDLTDGGLLMMASSVPRFEERHAALTAALAKFQPAGGES